MHCVQSQSMIMKITHPLPESKSTQILNLDSIKLFTYGLRSFIHFDRGIHPRISSRPQMDFPGLFLIGMPLIMVRAGYCMFWLQFSLVTNFGHYSTVPQSNTAHVGWNVTGTLKCHAPLIWKYKLEPETENWHFTKDIKKYYSSNVSVLHCVVPVVPS